MLDDSNLTKFSANIYEAFSVKKSLTKGDDSYSEAANKSSMLNQVL